MSEQVQIDRDQTKQEIEYDHPLGNVGLSSPKEVISTTSNALATSVRNCILNMQIFASKEEENGVYKVYVDLGYLDRIDKLLISLLQTSKFYDWPDIETGYDWVSNKDKEGNYVRQ